MKERKREVLEMEKVYMRGEDGDIEDTKEKKYVGKRTDSVLHIYLSINLYIYIYIPVYIHT